MEIVTMMIVSTVLKKNLRLMIVNEQPASGYSSPTTISRECLPYPEKVPEDVLNDLRNASVIADKAQSGKQSD